MLIAALEEYEDSGTTQKEDVKKTPAKMLPSIHCVCTICIFVVNARIVIKISVASIPSHIIHLDTKYLMVKTLAGTPTLSTCSLQIAEVIL